MQLKSSGHRTSRLFCRVKTSARHLRWVGEGRGLAILALLCLVSACAPTPKRVVILVDGDRRVVDTLGVTVQDVLNEQRVVLADDDRADPPVYAEVGRSATITVTRVQIKSETTRLIVPFERKLVRDESYAEGQMRVLQLGVNGETELTYAVTCEDGKEAARRETGRKIVTQQRDEVLAIGTRGSLSAVSLVGSIVYLANGNAWVMRNSSSDKRPLTTTGDLDGRAFSFTSDGRYLLFSRAAEDSAALNTLWLLDTLVVGEAPRALPVENVLYAQLSLDGRTLAYSTGERTHGAPGWKAHNDLWIAHLDPSEIAASASVSITLDSRAVWAPGVTALYGWWGANYAISPDGRTIGYAFADEIGYSDISGQLASLPALAPRVALKEFAPFRTRADWVWTPQVAWSPDSRFLVAAVHAPLDQVNLASDNPDFEVWALARDSSLFAPLARQTGMWAAPTWSPPDNRGESRIAFGVALSPSDSERSRYALYVMDRDGSNKRQLFPKGKEEGLVVVQVAWSPDGRQLVATRDGDLWLYDFASGRWSQLTANGASALPRWGK